MLTAPLAAVGVVTERCGILTSPKFRGQEAKNHATADSIFPLMH